MVLRFNESQTRMNAVEEKPGGIVMSVVSMKQLLECGVHFEDEALHLHGEKRRVHHRPAEDGQGP